MNNHWHCRRLILSGLLLFLGPRAHLRQVSSMGIGPLPFILFIKTLIYFYINFRYLKFFVLKCRFNVEFLFFKFSSRFISKCSLLNRASYLFLYVCVLLFYLFRVSCFILVFFIIFLLWLTPMFIFGFISFQFSFAWTRGPKFGLPKSTIGLPI